MCGFPRLPIIRSDKRTPSTVLDAFDETPRSPRSHQYQGLPVVIARNKICQAKPSQNRIELAQLSTACVSCFDLFNTTFVHLRLICLIATCATGILHTIDYARNGL